MRCAIIGMGNIGLALYRDLDGRLDYLIGIDINEARVNDLKKSGVNAVVSADGCDDIDVFIVSSATGPDMEVIYSIARQIQPKAGALVSIESTLKVGTMARVADLFRERGYEPGEHVFLVHMPHRVMFGHDASTLSMPRVLGGVTDRCVEQGLAFYSQFVQKIIVTHDIRVAELSKLVENSKRYVDVAFAEALACYCFSANIDMAALRKAVNSKSNVSLCYVDYGIGGECLPKDIGFLNELIPSPLFRGAMCADSIYRDALKNLALASGRRILVRGLGYKPGIPDLANSRALDLITQLCDAGCLVEVSDPAVPIESILSHGLIPQARDLDSYDLIIERGRLCERAHR